MSLKILVVEDRPNDAELMMAELRRAGMDFEWRRVDNEPDYLDELEKNPDLVLADFSLPHFGAPRALRLLRETGHDIPFIIVTGSIGEEKVVEIIREGATDYLLKDRLTRLPEAISRALSQRQLRQEKQYAESAERESIARLTGFIKALPDLCFILDQKGTYLDMLSPNDELLAASAETIIGRGLHDLLPEPEANQILESIRDTVASGKSQRVEYNLKVPAGQRWFEGRTALMSPGDNEVPRVVLIVRDITDRIESDQQLEQATAKLEKQNARLDALYKIGQVINSTLDTQVILEYLVDEAIRVTHASHAQVLVVKADLGIYERRALHGFSPEDAQKAQAVPLPLDRGVNGRAYGSQQLVLVDDVLQEKDYFSLIPSTRSELALPITRSGRVLGNLDLQSPDVGAFREVDIDYLNALTEMAAVALSNASLFESATQRAVQLKLVSEIGQRTTAILNADDLLRQAVQLVGNAFGYQSTSILLVENGGDLVLRAATLPAMKEREGIFRVKVGQEGVTGLVAASGQPLLIADADKDPRYHRPEGTHNRSELAVPIKIQDSVIGVFNVESAELGAFSDMDVFTLTTIADQLAPAIKNAQLYHELETYSDILQDAVENRTAQLQRAKEHVEAILNSVGEAVVVIGKNGLIQQINPAFTEQTGYAMHELERRDHREVLLADEASADMFHESSTAMRQGHGWRGEIPVRRRDGSVYQAAVSIVPLHDDEGQVTGFVGALRDITPLKEVARLKDEFVSNVSHELRTPITGLRLNHDMLHRDPAQSERYMQRIGREIERLNTLIEDLLRLSRMDQDRVPLDMQPLDVNALADEFVDDRAPLAEARGLTIAADKGPILPEVMADAGLLGQALSVLVTNALNYTPTGGKISIATREQEIEGRRWVGIAVTDTGPGITPKERDSLFQRFFRGTAGRASSAPGTGLGLAIAKQIVDKHHGKIEVQSEGKPGKGTTFTIWLPVEIVDQ